MNKKGGGTATYISKAFPYHSINVPIDPSRSSDPNAIRAFFARLDNVDYLMWIARLHGGYVNRECQIAGIPDANLVSCARDLPETPFDWWEEFSHEAD